MRLSQSLGQRVGPARNRHDVDVIGHQAVAQDRQAELLALLAQRLDVEATVVVGEEDVLAVVAPLSGVMRNALRHHARLSRHVLARIV